VELYSLHYLQSRVHKDRRENKGRKDLRDQREHKVSKVHRDFRDQK
jgi:hypothetical protein